MRRCFARVLLLTNLVGEESPRCLALSADRVDVERAGSLSLYDFFGDLCGLGQFRCAMRATRGALVHLFEAEGAGWLFDDDLFAALVDLLRNGATCIVQLVDALDEHKHHERNDEEVDDRGDERAEVDAIRRACHRDDQARYARAAARNEHDERLDDITDERRDNGCESRTDDDADRHIHHASAADELFEFADELHDPHPCSFVMAQGNLRLLHSLVRFTLRA